jgi:hypothetical protein
VHAIAAAAACWWHCHDSTLLAGGRCWSGTDASADFAHPNAYSSLHPLPRTLPFGTGAKCMGSAHRVCILHRHRHTGVVNCQKNYASTLDCTGGSAAFAGIVWCEYKTVCISAS